ncbi:cystatin-A-like [Porphyrio hochstetteri]
MMPGGLSEAKPATPEVQLMMDQVKPQLESRENRIYDTFEAVTYKTQVVAGLNYFVKVKAAAEAYIHVKVFVALPQENEGPRLVGYQTGKTKDDPLVYF